MKAEAAAPLILLTVACVGWVGLTGVAAWRAALPAQASGVMLASFPWGASDDEIFAAVTRAGGQAVRATWFPKTWVVAGEDQGFSGRLADAGALATFGDAPVGLPALGGCAVVSIDKAAVKKVKLVP